MNGTAVYTVIQLGVVFEHVHAGLCVPVCLLSVCLFFCILHF